MEFDAQSLFERVKRYSRTAHTVSLTGGEPLLHKDFLLEFLPLTKAHGFKNYLETNGTIPEALAAVIDLVHVVAMDVKLPSSTGLQAFWDVHKKFLKIAQKKDVFVKTIITEHTLESDIHEMIVMLQETNMVPVVVFQPDSHGDIAKLSPRLDYYRDLSISSGFATCVIPQMHKILGVR
jgi:organic radical activating enzyme